VKFTPLSFVRPLGAQPIADYLGDERRMIVRITTWTPWILAGAALLAEGAAAQQFPPAPADIAAAEAAGLRRIDAAELQRSYPGKRIAQSNRGLIVQTELRADGSVQYTDDAGGADTGTWTISERNGGAICRAYSKQMGRRFCTVYYAAPDGVHYFGYNPDDKAWRVTTRRVDTP